MDSEEPKPRANLDAHVDRLMEPETSEAHDSSPPTREEVDEPKAEPAPRVQRPNIPDYNEDPMGHLGGVAQHYANENQELRNGLQMVTVGHAIGKQAEEFKQNHPDYVPALQFYLNQEREIWREAGIPESQIAAELERSVAAQAMQVAQRGKNPAQVIYEAAKRRGFSVAHAYDALTDEQIDTQWEQIRKEALADGYVPGKRTSR